MINNSDAQDEGHSNQAQQSQGKPAANEGGVSNEPLQPDSVLPAPKWWSFLTIGVAMVAVLLGINWIAMNVAKANGTRMTNEFRLKEPAAKPDGATSANTAPAEITKSTPIECTTVPDAGMQSYLLKQRTQLVGLGDGNLDTAIEFGAYFFTNIVILAVFGLISLICLLIITKYGVSGTNGNIVAIFLLSTGIGLTYQSFFGVFQQRKNVEVNMAQAINYGQLVKQIDTYCITGKVAIDDPKSSLAAIAQTAAPVKAPPVNPATPASAANPQPKQTLPVDQPPRSSPPPFYVALEPADFILYIDAKMREHQKLSILFDDKAVTSFTDSSRLAGF